MPKHIPSLDREALRKWSSLSYPELVKELCSLFITADLIPRSTLSGEPAARRDVQQGFGVFNASACLCAILFTATRGWRPMHRSSLLLSVPYSLYGRRISPCWELLPSGKGVLYVQIAILVTTTVIADAVALLAAGCSTPALYQGFLLFHTLIETDF